MSSATAWAYTALRELGKAQRTHRLLTQHVKVSNSGGSGASSNAMRVQLHARPSAARHATTMLPLQQQQPLLLRTQTPLTPPRPSVHACVDDTCTCAADAAAVSTHEVQPHVMLLLQQQDRACRKRSNSSSSNDVRVARAMLLAPQSHGGVVGVELHNARTRLDDVHSIICHHPRRHQHNAGTNATSRGRAHGAADTLTTTATTSSGTYTTVVQSPHSARVRGVAAYLHRRGVCAIVAPTQRRDEGSDKDKSNNNDGGGRATWPCGSATLPPLLIHTNQLLGYCIHGYASPLYAVALPQLLSLRRTQLRSLTPAQCVLSTQYVQWDSWREVWAEPAWRVCTLDSGALAEVLRGTLPLCELPRCCQLCAMLS